MDNFLVVGALRALRVSNVPRIYCASKSHTFGSL